MLTDTRRMRKPTAKVAGAMAATDRRDDEAGRGRDRAEVARDRRHQWHPTRRRPVTCWARGIMYAPRPGRTRPARPARTGCRGTVRGRRARSRRRRTTVSCRTPPRGTAPRLLVEVTPQRQHGGQSCRQPDQLGSGRGGSGEEHDHGDTEGQIDGLGEVRADHRPGRPSAEVPVPAPAPAARRTARRQHGDQHRPREEQQKAATPGGSCYAGGHRPPSPTTAAPARPRPRWPPRRRWAPPGCRPPGRRPRLSTAQGQRPAVTAAMMIP